LFFIPPDLADQMNGTGPQNGWAHGQGSFDRKVIVQWIYKNSFRGSEYVSNIPRFIDCITSSEVPVRRLSDFNFQMENALLCVDVQGFELDVLESVDWTNPPKYIILEDDLGRTGALSNFMESRLFVYLGGDHDKLFARP
jgi:hypothetical protein